MSLNDPIADLLTRIRNACLRKHKTVIAPYSKIKEEIAKLLSVEGFIISVKKIDPRSLEIELKYDEQHRPVIRSIQRVSKPGLRIHKGFTKIMSKMSGQGIYIVSTSQGLLSDSQCRQKKIGGEIICSVY